MTKPANKKISSSNDNVQQPAIRTKHQHIVELLSRTEGTSLEEMSAAAHWLPHSTRSFLTGLKKKGHNITSDKVEGVRRYRIVVAAKAA